MDKLRFLHIPKTAGSTFNKILSHQYRGKRQFKFTGSNAEDNKRFRDLPKQEQNSIGLFSGHAPLYTGLPEADDIPIITILRDPVKRVMSFCQHVSEGKSPHLLEEFPPATFQLDEFLYSDNNEISNLQARMLVDHRKYRRDPLEVNGVTEDIEQESLDNLFNRIKCYGIQEYFDESVILFSSVLGWRMPYYEYTNRKNMNRLLKFEDRHIQRIKELNAVDIEIYRVAKQKFISRIESNDYDREKLEKFRKRQKYFSPMLHLYGVVGRAAKHCFR